jgi:hypothetical protein
LKLPLFDAPRSGQRRSWSDYSFDYQVFFVWEASLMALMFLSGIVQNIPTPVYEGALGVWFLLLSSVALVHRRRESWRWPGLSGRDLAGAGFGAVLMGLFLFVFSRGLLPLSRATAPMLLFALSIGVFSVLQGLRLVQLNEEDFKKNCADAVASPEPQEAEGPSDPKWMRIVRACYMVLSVLIWLEAMGFFYVHQRYMHEGSRVPTATQTESFNEHGALIYLTHEKMTINNALLDGMMIGIPLAILGGLFLHFVIGVSIFSNMPKVRGLFGKDPES